MLSRVTSCTENDLQYCLYWAINSVGIHTARNSTLSTACTDRALLIFIRSAPSCIASGLHNFKWANGESSDDSLMS